MPKRKRTKDEEKDEENSNPFRRYSLELHKRSKRCKRNPPSLMITPDFGPPKEVWSLLCSKDEISVRNWKALKKQEHVTNHSRCMIVDWVMEVCASLKLHRETFHLAVDYFDRYLCVANDIPLDQLQLIATAALTIASKFEEIYPPKISVLADYTDGACTAEDVIVHEQVILQELDWNFAPVTAVHWLALYLQILSKTNEKQHAGIIKIKNATTQAVEADKDEVNAANTSSFSDSFLRSIDGVNNALNDSICSTSAPTPPEGEGHVYIGNSLSVPKLYRDDFVHLTKVVDLLILDQHFLSFRYSELAAAILFCSYQPVEDIENITSIKRESISKLISMVQIFVNYVDERDAICHKSFMIEDVEPDEYHNIQRFEDNNYEALKAIVKREKDKHDELKNIQNTLKAQKQEEEASLKAQKKEENVLKEQTQKQEEDVLKEQNL